MPNQEESRDGTPRVNPDRPSPDVERYATDGQTNARGKGPSDEQGQPPDANLVAPSGVNERDRGAADVPPTTSEQLNFDDATEDHPRGDNRRTGGTWSTPPHNTGDQGAVGRAPGAGLSDRNGPSDPDARNGRPQR
ncbi:hypothetical protein [Acidovorax sp.]|uniref:hypothetical protein n=1 Tax=unclassified Acidovorax TaxID=2684926 RepID=UPI0025C4A3EC|nr:hypothetical protein [Acidovorax sp.]MCE1193156.1 hypothetical protein [Acidovorax sp.]